jgi:hypothetical protein
MEEALETVVEESVEGEEQSSEVTPSPEESSDTPIEETEAEPDKPSFDFKKYSEELESSKDSKLSEETRAEIKDLSEKMGIDPAVVDAYIADRESEYANSKNQKQLTEEEKQASNKRIYDLVGGDQGLEHLEAWSNDQVAQAKMTADQLDYYQTRIDAGGMEAELAVKALLYDYARTTGVSNLTEPKLLMGSEAGNMPKVFKSRAEVQEAMRAKDSRGLSKYDTDPVYRNEVIKKLNNSKF